MGANGNYHLQGYIEMPRPVRWSHFTGLEGAHFEKALGTPQQCYDYATKEDTRVGGPYVYGALAPGRGARTDILGLRDAVKSGKSHKDLFDDDATCGPAVRYARGVGQLMEAYQEPPMRGDFRAVLHFGPPGVGKTHCAHHAQPDAYYFDGNQGGFFIGYKGQTVAILDEFSGHTMPPLQFQRLCDVYPLWLPVKGGQVPCNIRTVHICSNYLADGWWSEKTKFNREAVYRRITEVHWHYELGSMLRYITTDPTVQEGRAMYKFNRDFLQYNMLFVNQH